MADPARITPDQTNLSRMWIARLALLTPTPIPPSAIHTIKLLATGVSAISHPKRPKLLYRPTKAAKPAPKTLTRPTIRAQAGRAGQRKTRSIGLRQPEDTPGGATASPADEQPASQGSETKGDDEGVEAPAQVGGTRSGEDKP